VFAPDERQRVGIELEWITRAPSRDHVPSPAEMAARVERVLGGSRLTFEPGGQLELSGPAAAGAAAAITAMASDVAATRDALAPDGVELLGMGLDPCRRERVVDAPRYAAMESYFDAHWPSGRTMMRNTAGVQVNLDLGDFGSVDLRWQRAHDLVPVLAAAFANSPFDASGAPTGWRSTRLDVWRCLDPRRTRPAARPGTSAATAWTTYALDAPVMFVRADGDRCVVPPRPLPFARWIHDGHELGWPTLDDFIYHLTTLFPPVRPRGWLELRVVDALPDAWWPVAVAVTTALLDDPEAADTAARAARPIGSRVADAARLGCADPVIGAAVERCFVAALPALARIGVDAPTITASEDYYERFVARGRCPADDLFPYTDPARLPAAT